MAVLMDSNNTGTAVRAAIYVIKSEILGHVTFIAAQTFTPSGNYELSRIKLLLSGPVIGGSQIDPGTIKCSLYSTNESGKPDSLLGSDTTNANTLPVYNVDPFFEWREFRFVSTPNLQVGTQYAMILSFTSGVSLGETKLVYWWTTGNQYAGGTYLSLDTTFPPDLGSEDWSILTAKDNMFETYGLSTGQFFPEPRPAGYSEDAVWNPNPGGTPGWTTDLADLTTLGGGRYGKQIVVVSNQAKIFFGAL